jgi:thymidylate kinase
MKKLIVTITGQAGAGKTTLADVVAEAVSKAFNAEITVVEENGTRTQRKMRRGATHRVLIATEEASCENHPALKY